VLYDSGEPFETISEIKDPAALDAITSPTPPDRNTRIAAERIRDGLGRNGVKVQLACYAEFSKADWARLLEYELVVLGTPARFWTVSWETKRFMDLVFGRIYVLPDKSKGKTFALFATAEVEESSASALDALETVVRDIKGNVALRLNLHRKMSQAEFDSAVDRFTDALSVLAK